MNVMSNHSLHLMDYLSFWVCCIGLKLPPKNNCLKNVIFLDDCRWYFLSMTASFQHILNISTYHMLRGVWLSISNHWRLWIKVLGMRMMTKRSVGGKRHPNFQCVIILPNWWLFLHPSLILLLYKLHACFRRHLSLLMLCYGDFFKLLSQFCLFCPC